MRLTFCAGFAVLTLGACGSDAPPNDGPQYATGQLPTADSVQRESDIQVASGEAREDNRRQEPRETSRDEGPGEETAN